MVVMHPTANRRDFIRGAGLAGIGAGTLASDAALQIIEAGGTSVSVGTPVVDIEAAAPDVAIVINTPEVPIREWWVSDGVTVADDNPTYDPNEGVVIVAFAHHLFDGWTRLRPADLFEAVIDRSIKFYSFPASRLTPV